MGTDMGTDMEVAKIREIGRYQTENATPNILTLIVW